MSRLTWEVKFTRQAEKDTARLQPWNKKALREIYALKNSPLKGHTLTGTLKGARSLEFSLPGGQYRAAYVLLEEPLQEGEAEEDNKLVCLVFIVGAHENFYEKAERRMVALKRSGLKLL